MGIVLLDIKLYLPSETVKYQHINKEINIRNVKNMQDFLHKIKLVFEIIGRKIGD